MLPHMDEASLKAIEEDGRSGWVEGPCLWLDHKRFAVGTVNGKLRRPDSEIAALKPVVYAADMTADPVHPNAAAIHKTERPAATKEEHAVAPSDPEKLSATAKDAAPTTSHVAEPAHPSGPIVSYQNIQDGAEMDTQANKPNPELTHAQSAEQAKSANTAAIIDPPPQREADKPLPTPGVGHATKTSEHMNMHESLVHDITIKKLQEESVSIIPSSANGSAHHGELLVASDPAKGLVLETAKLSVNGQVKPPLERFVTAAEGLTTANGTV